MKLTAQLFLTRHSDRGRNFVRGLCGEPVHTGLHALDGAPDGRTIVAVGARGQLSSAKGVKTGKPQ